MNLGLWGVLTIVALAFEVVFASLAFVYTRRLICREPIPMSEDRGGYQGLLRSRMSTHPDGRSLHHGQMVYDWPHSKCPNSRTSWNTGSTGIYRWRRSGKLRIQNRRGLCDLAKN